MNKKLEKHQQVLHEFLDEFTAGNLFDLKLDDLLADVQVNGKVWLLGAGKASVQMAELAEDYFGDAIRDGLIIAPEKSSTLKRVQVFEGSHPYPDENSLSASYELWQIAQNIPEEDTVVFCLSGGASALFCIPSAGIEMEEFSEAYQLLLNSGASIHEINAVRKHISDTGGGKLGDALSKHTLTSIILSDVPGDDVDVIGSGPTVPDSTTFRDAFHVLKKYQLWEKIPHSVRIHISKGLHGDVTENPQKEKTDWSNHTIHVISGAQVLAKNTGKWLADHNFNTKVAEKAYDLDVQKISKKICGDAIAILGKRGEVQSPAALIYFGESTVNVTGNGKGGRNQHLALSAAISIEGQHPISVISLATDGVDGPTDAAGAFINSQTTLSARKQKMEPESFLQNFDSYHFHEKAESLIKIGPTGNNLMDLQIVLVG